MKVPFLQRWFLPASLALSACIGGSGRVSDVSRDVGSALPQEDPGIAVLSLFWRSEMADASGDASPQEFASPALRLGASSHEDQLFVGSHDGWFYALNPISSELVWKVKTGSVSSRPLVHRGRIYVGTDDGFVICLDILGEEQWRYATRSPILGEPIIAGDALLVANEGDQVYSLDLETGKFRWLYKTDSDEEFTLRGHSGLTLDGDMVYAGFADGSVAALRTTTGSVAWLSSLRGASERFVDVDTTPIIAGDMVVAASSAGGLYALDKATGRIRWSREVSGGGGLVASDDTIFFAAAEAGIYALDFDGNIRWRQGLRGGGEPSQPALRGEYVFYGLSEAGLFVAKAATGEVVQYFDPGFGISSPVSLGRDRLYVMSNSAILYALTLN
ncbi:MAG: PQQ-binding-like beta-propeller repeat protein [Myxococcales bacterium]|nr:PQQ-binding-like beta-propeller repeat protein [Myxococcales bacterium]